MSIWGGSFTPPKRAFPQHSAVEKFTRNAMALAFSGLSGRMAKGRFAKAVKKPSNGTLDRNFQKPAYCKQRFPWEISQDAFFALGGGTGETIYKWRF